MLLKHLKLNDRDIENVKPTNTGWAVRARTDEIQELLIYTQKEWGPSVDLLIAEKNILWYTYKVKRFPKEILDWDGVPVDYNEAVEREVLRQTGQLLVAWHVSNNDLDNNPSEVSLMISFTDKLATNFSMLGTSEFSFELNRPKKIMQCNNCWNLHAPTRCVAAPVCKNCGQRTSSDHTNDSCTRFTQCTNCLGPHLPDNIT